MKTKQKATKADLLKVFNTLLFIERQNINPYNVDVITELITKDFLIVFLKFFCTTLSVLGIKDVNHKTAENFLLQDARLQSSNKELIKIYLDFFRNDDLLGDGFAPGMVNSGTSSFKGLNCLGKAAMLGSLLDFHKFKIKLALMPDHAAIIVFLEGEIFWCDPMNNQFQKMHGTFEYKSNYAWYTVHPDDKLLGNYLIIQDFRKGIANAIFESLQIQRDDILAKQVNQKRKHTVEFEFEITSIDWKKIRKKLFKGIEDYKKDYQQNYLLECVHVMELRVNNILKERYIEIVQKAIGAATFQTVDSVKKIKAFHEFIFPRMKPHVVEIVTFLNSGIIPTVELSEQSWLYLRTVAAEISGTKEVKKFVIDTIEDKIKKSSLSITHLNYIQVDIPELI